MKKQAVRTALALVFLAGVAAGNCFVVGDPDYSLCPEFKLHMVICCLYVNLLPLAQAIAALMFVYGGAKYVYSAEDPGGRKQAKSIAVNAIIGLLIVILSQGIVQMAGGSNIGCAGGCPL
jgi:hypothetical protein